MLLAVEDVRGDSERVELLPLIVDDRLLLLLQVLYFSEHRLSLLEARLWVVGGRGDVRLRRSLRVSSCPLPCVFRRLLRISKDLTKHSFRYYSLEQRRFYWQWSYLLFLFNRGHF